MKYEKDHQGCMRGILHLFNVHQRLHMRKMLWDKRHGVERHAAGGIRIPSAKPNIPGTVKGHNNMDIEPNFLGEDKINSSTKASGKACMRELIAEEMSKKQGQTQRVPDFSSRLMRTLSIHHLECNDYVRPEDMTSKSDTPRAIFHPHDTSYSASSEHMPLLPKVPYEANYSIPREVCGNINTTGHNQLDELGNIFVKEVLHKEELNEIESGFLGKKSADNELRKDLAYCRSQNVLDALVSFNTNREIFLKILQEPNSVALSKSSSFPTPSFSDSAARRSKLRHKRKETESFAMQEGKFQAGKSSSITNTIGSKDTGSWALSLIVDDKVGGSKPEQKSHIAGSEGNYEFSLESKDGLKDTTDDGTTRSHFKSIKHRIKDVIKESRKEGHRISRDGILHKIPYGFEASQDLKAERPGPWEGRESPRSQSDMIFSTNNKHAHHNIRRSRSLTESLYRYSQLFEFTLGKDSRRHTNEKPELAHEAGGSQVRDPPKMLGRIFSLPEFQSYFPGNDDQTTISSDVFYSRASSMDLAESNSDFNFNGFDEQKSVSSLVNTEGHTQLDTGMTNARLDEQKSVSSLVNTEGHTQLDTGMENASLDEQKPVSSLVNTEGRTQLDTGMTNARLDEQKSVSSLVNTEGHTQLDTGMENASLDEQKPVSSLVNTEGHTQLDTGMANWSIDEQKPVSSLVNTEGHTQLDTGMANVSLDEQKPVSSLVNTEGHTQLDTGMENASLDEQKPVSSLVNTEGHTQMDTGMANASLDEQKPVSSLVNTEGHTQLDTGMANASLDEQKPVSSLVNTEGHTQLDTGMANASLEHALEYNATGAIDGDQCVPDIEGDGIEMHDAQANSTDEHCRRTSLHEQEIEPDLDHSDKPGTPSPISVLNSYFQEDLISSAKFSASEGSELTPRNIPLELDSLVDPEDQSATDATNLVETVGADIGEVEILRKNAGIDAPHVQVDWKNEPDFNYVMNILKKSGFGSDEFLGTWYSSNQPVDPSLFEDMECSLYEDEISRYGSDINLDHLLLFDLINEALFKIYERSSALCPWIQCSDSQIRPTPMGHHVLKEVWANISWHLNSQPQLNPTLDYVVERDFTKNDGWMNLQTDRECVGLELESLIFDDLLDGAVLEFFVSCSHPGDLS